jgi:hypothetical protein
MSRLPKSKSGRRRFRPSRDKIPTDFSLQGTHLANPEAWLSSEVQKMAKGAVMRGDYFTLRHLAQRVTKAVFPVVCYWSPTQYQVVRQLSREPVEFSFEAALDQIFLDQLRELQKLQHFSRDQQEVFLCLCREVLDWIISHPVTPPGPPPFRPERGERPPL